MKLVILHGLEINIFEMQEIFCQGLFVIAIVLSLPKSNKIGFNQ